MIKAPQLKTNMSEVEMDIEARFSSYDCLRASNSSLAVVVLATCLLILVGGDEMLGVMVNTGSYDLVIMFILSLSFSI